MRIVFFIIIASVISFDPLFAQQKNTDKKEDSFEELPGLYKTKLDSSGGFNIKKENGHLILEVIGQGKTQLSRIAENRFRPKQVKPEAIIEFIKDSSGNIQKFLWIQPIPKLEWIRISGLTDSPVAKKRDLDEYEGRYKLSSDAYQI